MLDTPTVNTVGLAWTPTPTVKPSAYIATWQKLCFRQCVLGAIYADGKTVGLAFEQKKKQAIAYTTANQMNHGFEAIHRYISY